MLTIDIVNTANIYSPMYGDNPHFVMTDLGGGAQVRNLAFTLFVNSSEQLNLSKPWVKWVLKRNGAVVLDHQCEGRHGIQLFRGRNILRWSTHFRYFDTTRAADGVYEFNCELADGSETLAEVTEYFRIDRTDLYASSFEESSNERFMALEKTVGDIQKHFGT